MVATYKYIPAHDDDYENGIQLSGISPSIATTKEPLSIGDEYLQEVSEEHQRHIIQGPEILCLIASFLLVSLLLFSIAIAYHLLGRLWGAWVYVLHLHLHLGASQRHFNDFSPNDQQKRNIMGPSMASSFNASLDVLLCGIVYPLIIYVLTEVVFRDVDDTINFDWKGHVFLMRTIGGLGIIVALLRLGAGIANSSCCTTPPPSNTVNDPIIFGTNQRRISNIFRFANSAVLVLDVLCILSVLSHFGPWPEMSIIPVEECDPLDTTLCALPFPSFHHMKRDDTTNTGWRVDLKGLPPLRGGIPFHPKFLSELDGFSTMAPILFYMEGLKEAHEGAHNSSVSNSLQGPASIEKSTTNQSTTLLVNVDDHKLVAHSAEIDYLDPDHPLVMIMPASPLRHNTHYAVAVVNANDLNGNRLPVSKGLESALKAHGTPQHKRYVEKVLPALWDVADWTKHDGDPELVQLLFDFGTISEGNQIGHTRAARDMSLKYVGEWDWVDHVEVVTEINHSCSLSDSLVARTFHINLDVPSFLKHRSRYSTLDHMALSSGKPVAIAKAKAIIQVPCSVEQAAFGNENGKPVRAILEYGHGLFHHRGEVGDNFLSRMANENGYILMAMDWRGMSVFDMPIVVKTLIGNPNLFKAVRDNLIQGFSEKLVMQHFARNGMLDWLKIDGVSIPTDNDEKPTFAFYGISQGGILGGGYLALAGKTGLIDRGILGSPGTPFTSVLTRSRDFVGYDFLLLFNFYNNRHVRLLLSLVQMGWDSVEASGLLAPPVHEPLPPTLLQTGLGDPIVPTSASEAMTRAMHGSTLSGNRRTIFGVPVTEQSSTTPVVLTEIVYEKEYKSLPVDNTLPEVNSVHWCVRVDPAGIDQIEVYVNTGEIIDPCKEDQCHRASSYHC